MNTPPSGVPQRTSQSGTDEWGLDSEVTPPPSTVPEGLAMVARRQKLTQQTATNTLTGVEALRAELRADVADVDRKVDHLGEHVGKLSEQTSHMAGQVGILVRTLDRDRDERSEIHVAKVQAELQIRTTEQTAMLEDEVAKKKHRRELVVRIVAGMMTLWAAIATALAGHC